MRKRPIYLSENTSAPEADGFDMDMFAPPEQEIPVVGDRILYYQTVTTEGAAKLAAILRGMATELKVEQAHRGDPSPRPIHLHINSPGGELFAALAVLEVIRALPVPVHTHIEGQAGSAATLLSISGSFRTAGKYSLMLIHQLAGGAHGKFSEMLDDMENNKLLMSILRDIYLSHSSLTEQELQELLSSDRFFTPEFALSKGLIDQIV
jgi:ATP-dependent protease ClpP protease subunit